MDPPSHWEKLNCTVLQDGPISSLVYAAEYIYIYKLSSHNYSDFEKVLKMLFAMINNEVHHTGVKSVKTVKSVFSVKTVKSVISVKTVKSVKSDIQQRITQLS